MDRYAVGANKIDFDGRELYVTYGDADACSPSLDFSIRNLS
jgi:hypothetical protein